MLQAKSNSHQQQQQQQQQRRPPLSLTTSMKPTKSNDKNDNSKKEATNNQKTEFSKKDSKRSSSTSSTDSKKPEFNKNKNNKNEDNKKNQNGVNGNGIQDKLNAPNANEAMAKAKPESSSSSSNGSASKQDSQMSTDKKNASIVDLTEEHDAKKITPETTNETKIEETKAKVTENNKDKKADGPQPKFDQEKTKEKPDEVNLKNKTNEDKQEKEKTHEVKTSEQVEVQGSNIIEPEVKTVACGKKQPNTDLTPEKTKETTEKISEDASKAEKPLSDQEVEDVVMMEPLQFTEEPTPSTVFAVSTPAKSCSPKEAQSLFEVPSKLSPKSEVKPSKSILTHTPDRKSYPRTFSAISGRRSIRPIGDYTFCGNLQIRESYRKINTELDFTSSSLNVTVGSEVPNNESFSFFSRSRKRDRSSPPHQTEIEVQNELSPKSPKRPRIDMGMGGFFSAMASPISMLRARLARATVQSTPKKQIVDPVEQEIVENVSAIAVEAVEEDLTATEEQTFNPDSTVADTNEQNEEFAKPLDNPIIEEWEDIKIKETITPTESQSKKKCSIM